jgi:hypothetical protein
MPLDAAQQRTALQHITGWRSNPKHPVVCPACSREGLMIIDRSARPYAEWYALSCAACGLDETLHVALGPPVQSLD